MGQAARTLQTILSSIGVISEAVLVGEDNFEVMVFVTRPKDPVIDRYMDVIKGEVERLLPAWIKTKIQAGEP